MNIKNIYIHTYINNMQHYLLYIGDKTTTKTKNKNNNKKQKHFRGIYCVCFKRASIQNNRIAKYRD